MLPQKVNVNANIIQYLIVNKKVNTEFWLNLKMTTFIPSKQHLREVMLFCFNSKKSVTETLVMISEAYPDIVLDRKTCHRWFARFRSGNFDTEDKARPGKAKKFEDAKLEALLAENPYRTQKELADALGVSQAAVSKRLHDLGMVQKDE